MTPLITLEEHFYSKAIRADTGMDQPISQFPPQVLEKLYSISEDRIRDMNNGGVSLQIISHTPTQGSASLQRAAPLTTNSALRVKQTPLDSLDLPRSPWPSPPQLLMSSLAA